VEVYLCTFLNLALTAGERSASPPEKPLPGSMGLKARSAPELKYIGFE
jgi:hypothetical protein